MAVPKINLFTFGNKGGRPPKFDDPDKMEEKISEYFQFCIDNKMECAISGLCQYLGFSDRDALLYYEKKPEFSGVVKRARQAVELSYELDLRTFKFGGAIFALKNINKAHWQDKTEQEVKQTITNVAANFGNTLQSPQESGENTRGDK